MKMKRQRLVIVLNREIKFRAWNKVDKTMYTDAINNCKDTFDLVLKHPQIYEVMQYTGLKDCNGVEIFEGDIVIADEDDGLDLVVFKKGAFYIETLSKREFEDELLSEVTVEVKGNIFKNPELVEGERS